MKLALSTIGEALIKHFEGCANPTGKGTFMAYPDPGTGGAPWTVGWGSTGHDVHPALIWTQAECDARFDVDAQRFAASIIPLLGGASTNQNQFDAMVSFAYNLGAGTLHGSTLLKKHISGNYEGAASEFGHWNHAANKVMSGLTKRRAAEAALYALPSGHPAPTL